MTPPGTDRFDSSTILGGLKDFQRATVDHAMSRLYTGAEPTSKFLVADEVGLGKTLVARGVIARTIELLWDDVERIDIIYICSNRAIAEQNISRLNVFDDKDFSFSSRMTMVAKEVSQLRGNKVNFVSFTPGTSFDLKSTLGIADERVLLWHALRRMWGPELLDSDAARRIFQGRLSSLARFDELATWGNDWAKDLDAELLEMFRVELDSTDLRERFESLASRFHTATPEPDALADQNRVVGELRSRLAAQCVSALEPDLVILDEFQRFRDLLGDDSEAGVLANALFDYPDNRTLLLSATPYKMFTAAGDEDDDHHRDFVRTIDFLLGDDSNRFHQALRRFQEVLLDVGRVDASVIRNARHELEHELKRVMVRTERLAAGDERNGMLYEVTSQISGLSADDVRSYVALEQLSQSLNSGSMTEYWKSAPYFLNFTDGYKLDQHLTDALADPTRGPETRQQAAAVKGQVDWDAWRNYDALDPGNPRLRHLMAETTGAGRWQMLWLAPSLPYYDLAGPWAEPGAAEFTKRLIFSSWGAVPKAIASVLSYDAERQMMSLRNEPAINDPDERKKISSPLQFRRNPAGEPGAMSAFSLLYPSIVLAELDPLMLLDGEGPISQDDLKGDMADVIADLLSELPASPTEGRVDEAWYWAAPILLDLAEDRAGWMKHKRLGLHSWLGGENEGGVDDPESSFREHVEHAHRLARGEVTLGRRPDDLADVLVLNALGNPATLALRALWRVLGEEGKGHVWDAACRIAWGFRTLFNLPEASTLIRHLHPDEAYWRSVLQYSADGCLGSVLDEYVHCLREWLGIVEITSWKDVNKIAEECSSAVSLKSADYVAKDHLGNSGQPEHRFRSRFALRLGNERSESDATVIRVGNVRTSFNSPFWPFVLASTSIGQEGLDFHLYCHAIVHWNLPSNPVDLEQREGRIHRFKGHAIRRNVAAAHANEAWQSDDTDDVWAAMFDAASEATPGTTDLEPYWVYPGPAAIERHVLALPMSREVGQLSRLKRSVALYRLVFGQPRQEDLIEYLAGVDDQSILDELRIDLSP